eukprot:3597705-Pleurochrysis_carterae.AAC.1
MHDCEDDANMLSATPDRERELAEEPDMAHASRPPFSPMSDVALPSSQHEVQHDNAIVPVADSSTNTQSNTSHVSDSRVRMRLDYAPATSSQPLLVRDELSALADLRADHRQACDRIEALHASLKK